MTGRWLVIGLAWMAVVFGGGSAWGASVVSVSTTAADGIYTTGQTIDVTVQFSAVVAVTGVPKVVLATGGTGGRAAYLSGSGTSLLVFRYTIQAGDVSFDLDYVDTNSLILDGGSINEGISPAGRTLPVPGASGSISPSHRVVVDTDSAVATVEQVSAVSADGVYGKNRPVIISVRFSEPVAVTGVPTLSLNSSLTTTAPIQGGQHTDTLTFSYTPLPGDDASDLNVLLINVPGAIDIGGPDGSANLTLPASGGVGALNYHNNIVVETIDPTVTNVFSTVANTAYGPGAVIPVRVTFSEPVFVASGTPTLTLETGITDTVVSYASGSGTNVLVFTYTVGSGQDSADLDYIIGGGGPALQPLSANGATIRDAASNDANTASVPPASAPNSLGANNAIVIDTQAPSVTGVSATEADNTYTSGQLHIRVTFSEPVTVTGAPKLALDVGFRIAEAAYSSGTGTATLIFTYTIIPGDSSADLAYTNANALSIVGATIDDLVGNDALTLLPVPGAAGSLDANKALVVVTPPAVEKVDATTADGTYGPGAVIALTVTFTEPVDVTGTPTLTLNAGTGATATYTGGTTTDTLTFTYTVAAGHSAADLEYSGTDAVKLTGGATITATGTATPAVTTLLPAGTATYSLGANANLSILGTTPAIDRVTSSQPNGHYPAGTAIPITITFTEPVVVTGSPRLALSAGTPAAFATFGSASGANVQLTYTVQAGQSASDLEYIAGSLDLNGGTIANAVGTTATIALPAQGSAKSLGGSKDLVIDTIAPTVASITAVTANGTYGTGNTIDVRVTFTEPVTVTGVPQLALNVGSSASYQSGTGTSALIFRYTVVAGDQQPDLNYASSSALGLNGGTIVDRATNAAALGLPSATGPTSLSATAAIVISTVADTTAPTVVAVDNVTADGTYAVGDQITISVTFSEPVGVVGAPSVVLNCIGTSSVTPVATYLSGTGTAVLQFRYTVLDGHSTNDLDVAGATALRLNGGTIADAASNGAVVSVSVGSLAAVSAIAVNPGGTTGGKPPATTIPGTETGSGGCGLGGGIAVLALALLLAGRRRR